MEKTLTQPSRDPSHPPWALMGPWAPGPVLDDAHVEGIQARSEKSLVQVLHVDFLSEESVDWMGEKLKKHGDCR